jgi:hypothetical protein
MIRIYKVKVLFAQSIFSLFFLIHFGILSGDQICAAKETSIANGNTERLSWEVASDYKSSKKRKPIEKAKPLSSDINLKTLDTIYIPANPNKAETSMAQMIQRKLKDLYMVNLKIKNNLPEEGKPCIIIGRKTVVSSGMISEKELNSVKYDGYIIKAFKNRIALAGYAPQGTIYASYSFLRQIGLKIYPWYYSDGLEVFVPLPGSLLEPFSLSSKPFFEHRDGFPLYKGTFGETIREYSLGDLKFARGYGWDHTAGYLVPLKLYYDEHPEYFALKKGKRIPKSTPNLRVTLCMCNPDVQRISTERALEWMNIQKKRRYFAITDGDAGNDCHECAAMDPFPDYYTDRLLNWVNTVARSVKKEFPENICLTLAYGGTVKPPINVRPEPNVLIMYAPWYWNSRATSAVSLVHPLNIIAMEEFSDWSMLFPDQMAVYDYPQHWVNGTAERIKFYAKNGVRGIYLNGAGGNLFHWVISQLLWDPFLDTEELEADFLEAFYGPAAELMGQFFRLRRESIVRNSLYTRKFLRTPEFILRARKLLNETEIIAEKADLRTQTRILEGVLDGRFTILRNTSPLRGSLEARADPVSFAKEFEKYVMIYKRVLKNCENLGFNNWMLKHRMRTFLGNLKKLGVKLPRIRLLDSSGGIKEDVFEKIILRSNTLFKHPQTFNETFKTDPKRFVNVKFASPDEDRLWRFDASQTDLVSSPQISSFTILPGEKNQGIKISAPLSRFPVLSRGNIEIHVGKFYAEKYFNPILDVSGCFFLDFHFYSTKNVPISIYVNKILRSDVYLHEGEQIVRIDLRNFQGMRFNYESWEQKIRNISFEILPQDNFYPYPKAEDTDIIFIGMEAKNYDPAPSILPHRGKVIWMTHFRPNLAHKIERVYNDISDKYEKLMKKEKKYTRLISWNKAAREKFRTFTPHRILSPIFAVVTDKDSSEGEKQAAAIIQSYLEKLYKVKLYVNSIRILEKQNIGNLIFIGRKSGLATEQITPMQLKHVGEDGFIISSIDGKIVIAGNNKNGTFHGVTRYLEDLGIRFLIPGIKEKIPNLKDKFLHELYLLDWPFFKKRMIPEKGFLMPELPELRKYTEDVPDSANTVAAKKIAATIKKFAKSMKQELPGDIITEASQSPLTKYVAAKLLWNPFEDSTALIREFNEK